MLQEGLILTVVSGPSSCSILLFLLACGTKSSLSACCRPEGSILVQSAKPELTRTLTGL